MMKMMPVSKLEPGMKLAKDVFLDDGKLLLLAGFIIKPRYLHKLQTFNIPYVYIEEGQEAQPEEISEEKVYSEAFNTIKYVLSSVREGKDIDVAVVKDTVDDIVQKVINNESVFMQLTGIRDIDNYTFLHSVDVCIYSVITGKNLGFSREELTELAIGAILHDVGKCKIPAEILMKPASLTVDEFEIMKQHTVYGYDIINNTSGLNKKIADIACRHHEKWDGTGYPLGLKNYQIDRHSRIVTIADIYDALTADRVYRKRELPHEAAEYLIFHSSQLLDPEITKVFLRNIAIYPEDSIVLLNTGEIAKVVEVNKNMSIKPKVRVIARREGPPILTPYEINLCENDEVYVIEVLS